MSSSSLKEVTDCNGNDNATEVNDNDNNKTDKFKSNGIVNKTAAIVSNWDGYFEIENSNKSTISLLLRKKLSQRTPLNMETHNGYETMHKTPNIEIDDLNYENGDYSFENECDDHSDDDDNCSNHDSNYKSAPRYNSDIQCDAESLSRPASTHIGSIPLSGHITNSSSLLNDSITEIIIDEIQHDHEPTSAILDFCKRKFLRPYIIILSLVGLNPTATDVTVFRTCFSYAQAVLILILLLIGYFLQYICSYRGDRGFANYHIILPSTPSVPDTFHTPTYHNTKEVHTIGELLFGYIIPNVLHLCGFISAVIVGKIAGEEQLQNLIERVFLMSMRPRQLCRTLWYYVTGGFFLLSLLLAYVTPSVLMQSDIVQAKFLANLLKDRQTYIKVMLLLTLSLQDLIEIIVLSRYCIECYLLKVYLSTLSQKLFMRSIETLDWMREMLEFRKLLDHLNKRVAIPVCFFIVMNLAYAFAGFVYLFKDFDFHYSAMKVVILNIINVLLWLLMGLVPFFMAASVTIVCQTAQANGHQIRVRPFVYHNSPTDELNSTLLFASSLNMSAKLFKMPVQPNYVCFAIVIVSIVILTLGMCLNLTALGNF